MGDVPHRIRRALGRQREATRAAREAIDAAPADTFQPGDLDDLSERIDDIEARVQQSTIPDSGPPPVLSVAMEGGRHVRVRGGWLAALVVVVVGAVVAVWLSR